MLFPPKATGDGDAAAAKPVPEPIRASGAPLRYSSETLFAGSREILIEHDAQLYRLRRTALGKLILTK